MELSNLQSNKLQKRIFYSEILKSFDNIIAGVKNKLSSLNFNSMTYERTKLANCKKDLNEASNLLLSLETIQDDLSLPKKKELIRECKIRLNKFDNIKEELELYHDKLKRFYLSEEEYQQSMANNHTTKSKYLNLNNAEENYNDNDLTEHLLLEETRRNLEMATRNIGEVNTHIVQQTNQLEKIDNDLYTGNKYVQHSNKAVSIISNKRFYTKLILHLAVFFLLVSIVCCLVIKYNYKYKETNSSKVIKYINHSNEEYKDNKNNEKNIYIKNDKDHSNNIQYLEEAKKDYLKMFSEYNSNNGFLI